MHIQLRQYGKRIWVSTCQLTTIWLIHSCDLSFRSNLTFMYTNCFWMILTRILRMIIRTYTFVYFKETTNETNLTLIKINVHSLLTSPNEIFQKPPLHCLFQYFQANLIHEIDRFNTFHYRNSSKTYVSYYFLF